MSDPSTDNTASDQPRSIRFGLLIPVAVFSAILFFSAQQWLALEQSGAIEEAQPQLLTTLRELGADVSIGGQRIALRGKARTIHLKGISSLQRLDLTGIPVSDDDLIAVSELTGLVELNLSETAVTSRGVEKLRGLTSLEVLDLSGTQIDDAAVHALKDCTNLLRLNVSDTELTDAAVPSMRHMKKLTRWNIRNTSIHFSSALGMLTGDQGRDLIQALQILDVVVVETGHPIAIDLREFHVDDAALKTISGLSTLRGLNLSMTDFSGESISAISGLTDLEILILSHTAIDDADLAALSSLKKLKYLDLSFTDIKGNGLEHLPSPTKLESLNLSNCHEISPKSFSHLQKLQTLQQLDLTFTEIDDEAISWVAQLLQLNSLNLSSCYEVTDEGIARLSKMDELHELILEGNVQLSNRSLESLSELRTLRRLDLDMCDGISNDGLKHLTKLQSLEHLDVDRCTKVDDAAVNVLAKLKSLLTLRIYRASISDEGAWRLAVALPGCRVRPSVPSKVLERSEEVPPSWERNKQPLEISPKAGINLAAITPNDYPNYRGRGQAGILNTKLNFALDWKAAPPRALWRQPVGVSWSSFVIVGDYCLTQEQRGEYEAVVCRELQTGNECWQHLDRAYFIEGASGEGPRATPTVFNGRVYSFGATGILNCLDGTDGSPIWSRNVLEDYGIENRIFGMVGSPLVVDDKVIVCPGGHDASTIAFHCDTGEEIWASGSELASYSSPQLVEFQGRRQILNFNAAGLSSHDLATGDLLWHYPWVSNPAEKNNCCQPVTFPSQVEGEPDRVFISSGYGMGCAMLEIKQSASGFIVEPIWRNRNLKAKFTSVVYRDGFLYGLDERIIVCLDVQTGNRRWKRGRYGHGQLILINDLLLIQAESGEIALVEASPESYRELTRFPALNDRTWNHPALSGRYLLLRNDREATCLELAIAQD